MPPFANIAFPTRYRLGCGRRAELAKEAGVAGIARPLVVTDPGVAALSWMNGVLSALAEAGIEARVFDDVRSNPTEPQVSGGVAAYRDHGADGVIAIGGGSVIDTGKMVALLAAHEGRASDYEMGAGARWRQVRAEAVPPIVAVPTTAGSGSDLSTGAVVTDTEAGVKRTLLHAALLPAAVVADPEVTFDLPPPLTAATGMDALTHALEAYLAPSYHPMCDAIAVDTIALLAEHLPRATADGRDADARTHVMMAASMAAVAFQKGLGLVHAMAHPLGAIADLHHGLANGVLLPYVLAHNLGHTGDKPDRLARRLGLDASGDAAVKILRWLVDLRREVGIPHALTGVGDDDLARLPAKAMAEKLYLATNPAPVSEDDAARLYADAVAGRLDV